MRAAEVGAAAGRERRDQPNGPVRVSLRLNVVSDCARCCERRGKLHQSAAGNRFFHGARRNSEMAISPARIVAHLTSFIVGRCLASSDRHRPRHAKCDWAAHARLWHPAVRTGDGPAGAAIGNPLATLRTPPWVPITQVWMATAAASWLSASENLGAESRARSLPSLPVIERRRFAGNSHPLEEFL